MSLRERYLELCDEPEGADAVWKRSRGFKFERLLADLLLADKLDPRTGYRPIGEQIDGSLFLDGTVFLLEAKWHAEAIPASTLYQFKGKVDGKLQGTIGIFISMSGYSDDAVDALILGKSLNLILFDKGDIDAAILRRVSFKEILKLKIRKAAEEGVVYFPTEAEFVTRQKALVIEIEELHYDSATGAMFSKNGSPEQHPNLVIICEGDSDRRILAALTRRILEQEKSSKRVQVLSAMGRHSIPRVANAILSTLPIGAKLLMVADGDGDYDRTMDMFEKAIETSAWQAAIPDPEIETWLGLNRRSLQRGSQKMRMEQSMEAVSKLDLQTLRASDKAFSVFYTVVSET